MRGAIFESLVLKRCRKRGLGLMQFVSWVYSDGVQVDFVICGIYSRRLQVAKVTLVAYSIVRTAEQGRQGGGVADIAGKLQAFRPADLDEIVF